MAINFPRSFGNSFPLYSVWWDDNFAAINSWINSQVGQASGIGSLDASSVLVQTSKKMLMSNCNTMNGRYDYWISPMGETSTNLSESPRKNLMPMSGTFLAMYVKAYTNSFSNPLIITLRLNQADTGLIVSVPALSTALCSATASIAFNAGDSISLKVSQNASLGPATYVKTTLLYKA